ncbi:hypothetical protein SAMN05444406_104140 [Caldicoprobacter faecalis]|uniref:Uncharacterized protein n=1 Tax=Caldicoprobacter faecalis TaxID=937334 RepID=A0A1I5TII9_9FIRM|nr:hypothetical protein SAMN05444406_104140 [Caldicoprobacter faecalis]
MPNDSGVFDVWRSKVCSQLICDLSSPMSCCSKTDTARLRGIILQQAFSMYVYFYTVTVLLYSLVPVLYQRCAGLYRIM